MFPTRPRAALVALPLIFAGLATGCTPIGLAVGATATAARVALQERSAREAIGDAEIQLLLNGALIEEDPKLFRDVSSEVVEGRVLLAGAVPSRTERIRAQEIAWSIKGVREVVNEIAVGEDVTAASFIEDVWIAGQLRTRLIADRDVSSVNYNIETVNGVVHLIGLARSPEELARVAEIASLVPGVKRVVSHVLTFDDPRRGQVAAAPSS